MSNNNRQLSNRQRSHNNWIDSFFEDPFFRAFDKFDDRLDRVFKPSTDVSENNEQIKIVCNVPGMTKENLKIDIDDEHRSLTVSGNIEKEKKEENEQYHCVERSHGSFSRTVYLPKNADLEQIKANLENGVLRVTVPKVVEQPKNKRSVNIE